MAHIRRTRPELRSRFQPPTEEEREINGNYDEEADRKEDTRPFIKRNPTADLGTCFAKYDIEKETLVIGSLSDYDMPSLAGSFVVIQGTPNLHSLMHFVRRVLYPTNQQDRS